MIHVDIRPLTYDSRHDVNRCDNSFTVEAELRISELQLDQPRPMRYTFEPVQPYLKRYGPEVYDPEAYIGRTDRAAWMAYVDDQVAGQLLVHEHWNRLAIIWDIVVHPPLRRQGIGRLLMNRAITWAHERGLPGVMLETQNINAAGCRLYERCGFVLGGFDRFLYEATLPGAGEIALFWYLFF